MSECGAVQILAPDTLDSDVLGFAEPQDCFRIQDESDQRFYRVDEGVRTGILYMTSDSHCENTLDGEKLFDFTEIDGRDFICTNDLVHVNEDGSLSYDGRADRYFVNMNAITPSRRARPSPASICRDWICRSSCKWRPRPRPWRVCKRFWTWCLTPIPARSRPESRLTSRQGRCAAILSRRNPKPLPVGAGFGFHAFRGVEFSVNFAKAPLLFQCNDVKCEANRKRCQFLAAGGGHEQAYPEAPQRKAV